MPELDVSDIQRSISFWCDLLGFQVAYERAAAKFAYLERKGAQVMLCEINGSWQTGALEYPLGRGINFQIEVPDTCAPFAKPWQSLMSPGGEQTVLFTASAVPDLE